MRNIELASKAALLYLLRCLTPLLYHGASHLYYITVPHTFIVSRCLTPLLYRGTFTAGLALLRAPPDLRPLSYLMVLLRQV